MNTEQAVLGAVLLDSSVFDEIELSSDDFNDPKNARVWQTMIAMRNNNEPIDIVTVGEKLPQDREFIYRLTDNAFSSQSASYYASQVADAATRRRVGILAQTIIAELPNKSAGELIDLAKSGIDRLSTTGSDIASLDAIFDQVSEEIRRPAPLIRTAFNGLNRLIGGYRNGAMYVVAARPGVGKTIFALQTAFDLANDGTVLFFSMEMGANELVKRLMSSVSSVEAEKIIGSELNETEYKRILAQREKFGRSLFIQDRASASVNTIRAAYRKLNRVKPVNAIVIDYLGLMHDAKGGRSRYEKVTNISNDLKQLARELNVPVIALHQLNREVENRTDPKPTLSDLRDSGAIEQDADVVMLLHREMEEGRFSNRMRIFVAKNRHGQQGLTELTVHPAYVRVAEHA